MSEAFFWVALNIISTMFLAFYSMQEMACVSFNKIRLQYYYNIGMRQAKWLNYLLTDPTRLFGTTLVCVNAAMFIGSECARQTFIALNINPSWAVIPQVAFVLLFGELAPMFAARRYAEHVALLGSPILYASAKLLSPLLWSIKAIARIIDYLIGAERRVEHTLLNQEDLQKILDAQDEDTVESNSEVNTIAKNIFSLRSRSAQEVMDRLEEVAMFPANGTVEQLREFLSKNPQTQYIPLFHRDTKHIVGIVNPRNYIRAADAKRVRENAEAPWFITRKSKVMQILKEFRRNNKNVAIVLDEQGLAVGMITLEILTEELFGKIGESYPEKAIPSLMIDRTFPGNMAVREFNAQFDVVLSSEDITLGELIEKQLGHHPEVGESVHMPPFDLTVKETTFTEVKTLSIKTRL